MSTRPQLPLSHRLALHREIVERKQRGLPVAELARLAGVSQPAAQKAFKGPDVGADVAEKLVRALGFKSIDDLVRKHETRLTAGDVVRVLKKYDALVKAIEADSGRWDAARLLEVVAEVKDAPPRATPDGRLLDGSSWRDVLDGETAPPKVVGGTAKFRQQIRGAPNTPKGV